MVSRPNNLRGVNDRLTGKCNNLKTFYVGRTDGRPTLSLSLYAMHPSGQGSGGLTVLCMRMGGCVGRVDAV